MFETKPVFKPARKLSLLLQTRVILETPTSMSGLKFNGADSVQFYLVANSHNSFFSGVGAAIELQAFNLTEDQAFEALADEIAKLKKVKFHLPILPVARGIEHCSADIHDKVAVRAVEYYEIRIDEILTRYDVLVQTMD